MRKRQNKQNETKHKHQNPGKGNLKKINYLGRRKYDYVFGEITKDRKCT